jgi:hypothetical protein
LTRDEVPRRAERGPVYPDYLEYSPMAVLLPGVLPRLSAPLETTAGYLAEAGPIGAPGPDAPACIRISTFPLIRRGPTRRALRNACPVVLAFRDARFT